MINSLCLSYCLVIIIFSILFLHHYCAYLSFIQLLTLKLTAMSAVKRSKSDAGQFEESWTADVIWFICRNDKTVCTLAQCTIHSAVKMSLAVYLKY